MAVQQPPGGGSHFHIRIRFGGLLSVIGRDTYIQGRGRMLIKFLDLYTMGDGTGEEYDTGELVTYLNDAVLIAPSMLLVPEISWAPVDADSFDVSLTDHGRTVTARVIVDDKTVRRGTSPQWTASVTTPMNPRN